VAQASSETAAAGALAVESASATVTLPAAVDLHARPAADFVRAAISHDAAIWLASGDREVDAKSLLSILALGAKRGTELRLRAEGAAAAAAVESLAKLVRALRE
jgi:phosphocarrier protein HPr